MINTKENEIRMESVVALEGDKNNNESLGSEVTSSSDIDSVDIAVTDVGEKEVTEINKDEADEVAGEKNAVDAEEFDVGRSKDEVMKECDRATRYLSKFRESLMPVVKMAYDVDNADKSLLTIEERTMIEHLFGIASSAKSLLDRINYLMAPVKEVGTIYKLDDGYYFNGNKMDTSDIREHIEFLSSDMHGKFWRHAYLGERYNGAELYIIGAYDGIEGKVIRRKDV